MKNISFMRNGKEFKPTKAELERVLDDYAERLGILEKALELACEEINRVEAKFGSAYIRANGYLFDYFKTKAKEMK